VVTHLGLGAWGLGLGAWGLGLGAWGFGWCIKGGCIVVELVFDIGNIGAWGLVFVIGLGLGVCYWLGAWGLGLGAWGLGGVLREVVLFWSWCLI
jgi:hypothetical protein